MTYIIRLMNRSEIPITEEEYHKIGNAQGLIYIASQDRTINTQSIVEILPARNIVKDLLLIRRKNNEGILHDGTRVIRQFGTWYDEAGDYTDDGRMLTRLDFEAYPEVARDCVPSPSEYYEKYSKIKNQKERLVAILSAVELEDTRYLPRQKGMQSIEKILKYEKF